MINKWLKITGSGEFKNSGFEIRIQVVNTHNYLKNSDEWEIISIISVKKIEHKVC